MQDPFLGLRVGHEVLLEYSVEVEGQVRARNLWFSASVRRLTFSEDGVEATLRAKIDFKRTQYFPPSTSVVHVLSTTTMRDEQGQNIPWRKSEQVLQCDTRTLRYIVSEESANSEQNSDEVDADFVPLQDKTLQRPSIKRKVNHGRSCSQGHGDVARELNQLHCRLDYMQTQLTSQCVDVQALKESAHVEMSRTPSTTPDALLFHFHRLEKFLLSIPSKPGSEQLRTSPLFKQDCFSAVTDCTLSVLDTIWIRVQHKLGNVVEFLPSLNEVQTSTPTSATIKFRSVHDLLHCYRDIPESKLSDVLVKTRYERGSEIAIVSRVLGCARKVEGDHFSAFYLSPGGHLDSALCNGNGTRKLIYRQRCDWNNIEKRFQYPLTSISMPEHELSSHLRPSKSDSMSDEECRKSVNITMCWKPLLQDSTHIFSTCTRQEVLGQLTINVPHVIVRGHSAILELHSVLNIS